MDLSIKYSRFDMAFVTECMAKNCQNCSSKPNKCIKCKAGYKKNKKGRCGMFTNDNTDGVSYASLMDWTDGIE